MFDSELKSRSYIVSSCFDIVSSPPQRSQWPRILEFTWGRMPDCRNLVQTGFCNNDPQDWFGPERMQTNKCWYSVGVQRITKLMVLEPQIGSFWISKMEKKQHKKVYNYYLFLNFETWIDRSTLKQIQADTNVL